MLLSDNFDWSGKLVLCCLIRVLEVSCTAGSQHLKRLHHNIALYSSILTYQSYSSLTEAPYQNPCWWIKSYWNARVSRYLFASYQLQHSSDVSLRMLRHEHGLVTSYRTLSGWTPSSFACRIEYTFNVFQWQCSHDNYTAETLWDMWNLFFLKSISVGIQSPCERMIWVSNHPRNEKYLGSMKQFSEGEPESLGFGNALKFQK